MTPEEAARIVGFRNEGSFIALLREAAADFDHRSFEPSVAHVLRAEPSLIEQWATFSADQRWTPSAYVEGCESGWYDAGYQHVRVRPDQAGAIADFIHRLSVWLSRHEVLVVRENLDRDE
jgi:hypothetical protein